MQDEHIKNPNLLFFRTICKDKAQDKTKGNKTKLNITDWNIVNYLIKRKYF